MIGRVIVALDVGNTNITVGIVRRRRRRLGAPRRDARRRRPPMSSRSRSTTLLALGRRGAGGRRRDRARQRRAGGHHDARRASRHATASRILVADATTVPIPIRVDKPAEAVGDDRLVNAFAALGCLRRAGDRRRLRHGDNVRRRRALTARSSAARIAPGLGLGLDALAARTAKLPRVELVMPPRAIGRDTVSAHPERRGARLHRPREGAGPRHHRRARTGQRPRPRSS